MTRLMLSSDTKKRIVDAIENEGLSLTEFDRLASEWRCLYPKTEEMRLAQESYEEDFLVRMAYNSNAIEGSTLTLADTEIIYEGEFIPHKPGREQIAARGLFEGATLVENRIYEGASLDEAFLRDLHEACALDLQPRARGMYRSAPAIIRASRTVPSDPLEIRAHVADLFYQCKLEVEQTHPLIVVPWFHAAFENIHPFADGNGRTGRLWMNAQLRKFAYPPIGIKVDNSREYKTGLEAWQADNDPVPFMILFLNCLKSELESRIAFLSHIVEQPAQQALSQHDQQMLGILYYQPSISARMLGRIMGLSERQVQRMQKKLREEGLLKREGSPKHGKWVLRTER